MELNPSKENLHGNRGEPGWIYGDQRAHTFFILQKTVPIIVLKKSPIPEWLMRILRP